MRYFLLLSAVVTLASAGGRPPPTCTNFKARGKMDARTMKAIAAKVFAAAAPFTLDADDVQTAAYNDRSGRLFKKVNEKAKALRHPTYTTFAKLEGKFDPAEGKGHDEREDGRERQEVADFWAAVCDSPVTAILKKELESRGIWRGRVCEEMRWAWASFFSRSRGAAIDSSGFEHVMMGDERRGKVGGNHFWYHLYHLEKSGQLHFERKIRRGQANVLAKFEVGRATKPMGSAWIGQPIEQDIVLGTFCIIFFPNQDCPLGKYKGCETVIQAYPMAKFRDSRKRCFVSSSFPSIPKTVTCDNRV